MKDYIIRPSSRDYRRMGLYERIGDNRYHEIFTGEYRDCQYYRDERIKEEKENE